MFRKIENLNFFEDSLWVWDVITPLKLVYHVQQNQVLLVQTSAPSPPVCGLRCTALQEKGAGA